ncbi:anti-repressor SinI family protein [Pseudalkalibacillus decolorationis]|nr:anti-repressor SinI family protein [Pseudalkalibacillus decolorationis]
MEKGVKENHLDSEWIELMKVAKQAGLTKNEIREYFQNHFSLKTIAPKA